MRIDDFNGNNFDHTGLGFIRGGTVGCSGDGAPVSRMDIVPPDVRSWGKEYKEYFMRYYTRTFDIHMAPETLPATRQLRRSRSTPPRSLGLAVAAGDLCLSRK